MNKALWPIRQISDQPISHSFEMTPDIIIDLDKDNAVVGIDFQHVTELVKEHEVASQQVHASMKLQLVPA